MSIKIIQQDGISVAGAYSGNVEEFNFYEDIKEFLTNEQIAQLEIEKQQLVEDDILFRLEEKKNEVRRIRNQLLLESDWTQLLDVSMQENVRVEWANYRQQLRDVTQQVGFPETVQWPAVPIS